MLDRPRRGLAHGGRDLGRAALGDHHTRRPHTLGRAADRAQVLGVLDLVKRHDQRIAYGEDLPGARIGVRAGVRAEALVGA